MIANPGCVGDDAGEDGDEEEQEGDEEADSAANLLGWDQEGNPGQYNKQTWGSSFDNDETEKIGKSKDFEQLFWMVRLKSPEGMKKAMMQVETYLLST